MRLTTLAAVCAVAGATAACSPAPPDAGFAHDPWERTNREIHSFNKGWDTVLIRPAAEVYDAVAPGLVRMLIGNGLDMLDLPAIFVNQILQGDAEAALATAGRFGVNVVMGGVLLDPATELGLPKASTDLGVTFARWGVEEGPYVELPFLGPATVRDGVGRVTEIALDPFNFLTGVPELDALGPGTAAAGVLEFRASNATVIDQSLYESADSYVTTRAAYLQFRRRQIAGGATAEALPDVFAE